MALDPELQHLIDRLKEARQMSGWSQSARARQVGTTRSLIHAMKRGKLALSLPTLLAMTRALRLSLPQPRRPQVRLRP